MCSTPVASKHNKVGLLNRALLQWWRYVFSKLGCKNAVPGMTYVKLIFTD